MKAICISFTILAAMTAASAADAGTESTATSAATAASAPAAGPVTEEDLLAALRPGHPAVAALGEELARAEGARRRAGTPANPRFEVLREEPDPNARQTTWSLSFVPPLDGRLALAKRAADAGVEAARRRREHEERILRRELRRLHAEWGTAVERADVLAEQAGTVSRLAELARRRAEGGETSGNAATRLELAAAEERGALAMAEAEGAKRRARVLAIVPGIGAASRPVRPLLPALAESGDDVVRPDVEALRADARAAELEARLARRFVTFPELSLGWQRQETRPEEESGPVFGLAWNVPLFDRLQGARREAEGRRRVAEARLSLREAQAGAELAAARAAYARLREASRRAQEEVRGAATLTEGATASFRAGETTATELVDALRAVRDARLREIDVHAAAREAFRELELAAGGVR